MSTATESRAETIERIVELAREPLAQVMARWEFLGTDGNWHYPAGFPFSVKPTGEKRIAGYVACDKYGVGFGKRYPTEADAIAALEGFRTSKETAFRKALAGMSAKELASQLAYWESEKTRFRA